MKCYAFISGVVIAACSAPPTRADDFADRCRAAVEKSLPLITASAEKYTQERKCFSCHHQALPGMTVSHLAWRGYGNDFEKYRQQLNFTVDYFEKRREQIVEGKGIPGGAYSAGYALQLISGYYPEGRAKDVGRDLIKYLIKQQRSDGSWSIGTHRPPMEDSDFAATALAAEMQRCFYWTDDELDTSECETRAKAWLELNSGTTNEDLAFRLLGLRNWHCAENQIENAAIDLLDIQREDGGWAQLPGMESDAYATGLSLYALNYGMRMSKRERDEPAYRRGCEFLLSTQLPDGSWKVQTRSKPIQTYFESGYPHGKSQFISIAGACWATMALAEAGRK